MDTFTESSPHRPLSTIDSSEIRLVALHPGGWDDTVVCTLKHVSLDVYPVYNTVSYAWGDPTAVYEITLDNVSYPVAANLWQVLHRLRDYHRWHPQDDEEPSEPLMLWIDAICINQADKVERSAQVQRMSEIYTKATKVFACAGEIEPWKEDAIEKLFSIPLEPLKRDEYREEHGEDNAEAEDDDQSAQSSTGPSNWFSWKELAKRVEEDPSVLKNCIVDLCAEAFFSRIWIVQELTLGRHLDGIMLYGPHSINTIFFLELLMALRYDNAHSAPDFLEICKVTETAFAMVSGGYSFVRPPEMTTVELAQHLIDMIRATQHFHATEPRDKIYALLGLINKDLLPANLLPSYEEPIGEVYKAWTKFLLENTGDLSIIDGSFVQDPSVPTWVSSLSFGTDRRTEPIDPANVRFSDDREILYVNGRLVSFVLGAYSPPNTNTTSDLNDISSADFKASLTTQVHEIEETLMRHVRADEDHGASYILYLFDLMIRQHDKDFTKDPQSEARMHEITEVYEQILSNDDSTWKTANTDILQTLRRILTDTHWVVLSDGAVLPVNIGYQPIKPADEVYALEGSSGLTILRRREEQETFMRVGHCDSGTEREEWSGLESAVNGVSGVELGGRGTFLPRVGRVEIALV